MLNICSAQCGVILIKFSDKYVDMNFHKRIFSDKSFQSNYLSSVNIQYYLYCPKKFTFYLQCIQTEPVSGKPLSIMLENMFLFKLSLIHSAYYPDI